MRRLRSLGSNRRGSTIVEFAMLAPVMILLICGGIEYGHFYLVKMTLEGATAEAARDATASQEQSVSSRETAVRARIQQMMAGYQLQSGKQLEIEVKSYTNFAAAGTPEPFTDINGNGKYDPPGSLAPGFAGEPYIDKNSNGRWDSTSFKDQTLGATGEVVSYTAIFPAAYQFEFMRPVGSGGVTLSATVVTRNEPVVIGGPST